MRRKLISAVDRCIFIQFLATHFLSIVLILVVAIAFSATEKPDRLLQSDVPLRAIIRDYCANFVPYYVSLFNPLFAFIAVVYVTPRLAENSEIIAILSCGMSFRRLLESCMSGAVAIAILTLLLSGLVILPGNRARIDFQNRYIKGRHITYANVIQMQVTPEASMLMSYYNGEGEVKCTLSMGRFEGKNPKSRVMTNSIIYDMLYNWQLQGHTITHFGEQQDTLFRGNQLDTITPVTPRGLLVTKGDVEMLTIPELHHSIQQQHMRGAAAQLYIIELRKRIAMIPASLILTLMDVSLSVRKRESGMELALAVGLSFSFVYILFVTVTAPFAVMGAIAPMVAAWLPNLVYLGISFVLYRLAPRQIGSNDARGRERRDPTR